MSVICYFVCVCVCGRAVQEQCCAGALRESRCLTGMYAARAGEVCEDSSSHCGEDTQKVRYVKHTHKHIITYIIHYFHCTCFPSPQVNIQSIQEVCYCLVSKWFKFIKFLKILQTIPIMTM